MLANVDQEKIYRQAYLARDARFDGQFFLAVKTTGIYCRPVCPARSPLPENVIYFRHAHQAANAGFRPCLRCRPDSAPGSPAWNGTNTTLTRAKRLLDNGALETGSLQSLCEQLGISDRYLRRLFDKHLGISPKAYALFKQCNFAKNLLHQTKLPVTQIALASGFKSVRRFNDCFKKQFSLSPSKIRKEPQLSNHQIHLKLYFRPPYNWVQLQSFLSNRLIDGLEWSQNNSYGRTFSWNNTNENMPTTCEGWFTAHHNPAKHCFDVDIEINKLELLKGVVNNIRRILDLDSDIATIEQCLKGNGFTFMQTGLRLPGIWSLFEAGIRAILGQQISVRAARNMVKILCDELGGKLNHNARDKLLFPTPEAIATSRLDFMKMPEKRKQTLRNLAYYYLHSDEAENTDNWLDIKGIGPWTVDYAKMRGLSDPDIYLGGDLGVKKAMDKTGIKLNPDNAAPFRSYLTFQLWNQLK